MKINCLLITFVGLLVCSLGTLARFFGLHLACYFARPLSTGQLTIVNPIDKSLPLSGYYNNGSANNQGSNGNFWSVTRNNNNNMYNLNANTSNINPSNNNNRNNGNSVRCVLDS